MMKKGFTLTELLVTVTVLGILVAVAIPQYQKTVESSYYRTANDIVMTMYSGENVRCTLDDVYLAAAPTDTNDDWRSRIYMDNPNGASLPVTFGVMLVGGGLPCGGFFAYAQRNGGACNMDLIVLNHNRLVVADTWTTCVDGL